MNEAPSNKPLVVAVGGTLRPGSSTERALRVVLAAAEAEGAQTEIVAGADLDMPLFTPGCEVRSASAQRMVDALRRADAIVLGSPGYHGSVSGLVKNALDYTEDMRGDTQPYFHNRAVASVATGAGWQGAVSTLATLRGIVHALRGWNTPLGVAINTAQPAFDEHGRCVDARTQDMLECMGRELVGFARMRERSLHSAPSLAASL